MTSVLYNNDNLDSKISCGFDGYKNTPGRHEGIDFSYKMGANVYALTGGEVTVTYAKKKDGTIDKTGLTQIAVYDAEAGKTVIYLHADPLVETGDVINPGDLIALESNKGSKNNRIRI